MVSERARFDVSQEALSKHASSRCFRIAAICSKVRFLPQPRIRHVRFRTSFLQRPIAGGG